jgi:hypothetical protein
MVPRRVSIVLFWPAAAAEITEPVIVPSLVSAIAKPASIATGFPAIVAPAALTMLSVPVPVALIAVPPDTMRPVLLIE